MDDPNFKNTIVVITELNEAGATGFILNQPFGRNLTELAEFSSGKPFPLQLGGPVDQEHLYFIHRQPSFISGGQLITDDLFFGGSFIEVVETINTGLLNANEIKIFVGYCGWDAGELEAEVVEGSWELVELPVDEIFNS